MKVLKTMVFLKNFMKIKGCLTHKSDLWKTPRNIYDFYKNLNFYDPCPENPTFNGLEIEWKDKNFVNPPYSQISKWIDKAINEKDKGHNSVLLLPARTDTKWFRKLIETKSNIVFLQGRLHFSEGNSAPFPSMLVNLHKGLTTTRFIYVDKEKLKKWFN